MLVKGCRPPSGEVDTIILDVVVVPEVAALSVEPVVAVVLFLMETSAMVVVVMLVVVLIAVVACARSLCCGRC